MAMLSLLRNHHGHALVATFKLRPSVLPLSYVATRHFLTTSPGHSPARKAVEEANSKSSTADKPDGKEDAKSKKQPADVKAPIKPVKPKRSKYQSIKRHIL